MKINKLLQASGVGFATLLTVAFTANNAQALDFGFSGISAPIVGNSSESISVDGTISVDDGVIPASGSAPIAIGNIDNWDITINNSATGGSNTLNASNSKLTQPDPANNPFSGEVSSSDLEISGFNFCFSQTTCTDTDDQFKITDSFYAFVSGANEATGTPAGFPTGSATATVPAPISATAVPFGVSTDLSLLIIGGIWGASRLRKKMTANN